MIIADVNLEVASKVVEACGNGAYAVSLDVSDVNSVRTVVAEIIDEVSHIDVLVNNAGINRDAMLHKMTDDQWDSVLAGDLSGQFYMCREIGTHMRQYEHGRIINVASASWMGNIGQTNYAAAKGGVVSLTRSIAKELARKNVTANAICPGFIDTEMTRGMPEEIFNSCLLYTSPSPRD